MGKNTLNKEILNLRDKLHKLLECGFFYNEEILEASYELDKLIIKYYKETNTLQRRQLI